MKKIIFTTLIVFLSISHVQAQEKPENNANNQELNLALKDGVQADIYVDGKKFAFPLEIINKDHIQSMMVLKGKKAMEMYQSKKAVVIITTKKGAKNKAETTKKDNPFKNGAKAPVVIINGKISDQKTLQALTPNEIESIAVIKNKEDMKKYNTTNGVIKVITRKQ